MIMFNHFSVCLVMFKHFSVQKYMQKTAVDLMFRAHTTWAQKAWFESRLLSVIPPHFLSVTINRGKKFLKEMCVCVCACFTRTKKHHYC